MQNEWGLSIGESTATAMTAGWAVSKPWGRCRVGIEDLTKLALERCKTARCAVQTMGDIAVEQGFYSADSGSPQAPAYSGSSESREHLCYGCLLPRKPWWWWMRSLATCAWPAF